MRRPLLFLSLSVVFAACVSQTAPSRDPLPPVEGLVEQSLPCGFLLGDGLGVSIEEVVSGGSAEGVLEPGDLLIGLDGAAVANAEQLRSALSERAVGDEVGIEFVRGGDSVTESVVLGPNPDDPDRPLLGVMIETEFDRVAAADVSGVIAGGPFTRAIAVGERLMLVDPLAPAWGSLDIAAPVSPWAAVAGGVYVMEDPDTPDAALRDVISQDRIIFEIGEWQGSRVLGTLGDRVLVSASRSTEAEGLFEIGVMLIDVRTRLADWIWIIDDFDLGIPIIAFPSPDETRVIIAGQNTEDQIIRYVVLSSAGAVQETAGDLAAANDLVAVGWFGDRHVLLRSEDGTLSLFDPAVALVEAIELSAAIGPLPRAWAVGDGTHILADTGSSLVRLSLDPETEVRVLADRCVIGQLGEVGWTP